MGFLGRRFLLAEAGEAPGPRGAAGDKSQARLGQRLHPHSAFMTGLVRVMGNLGVLVFWIVLAANFISREWVTPDWPGKLACVTGVALGVGTWFAGLSGVVSLGQGQFSQQTLLRMEHLSGIALLALALLHRGTSIC